MVHFSSSLLAASALAASVAQAAPQVYTCGDSTMALTGYAPGSGTIGWGSFLGQFLNITVNNYAIGGRSARSFTREGRFASVSKLVKPGDFVIIEFGHNDGGSLKPTDNGRTDCFGTGNETCQTVYGGMNETVYTFPTYIINAAKLMQSRGGIPIISAQTPNNPYDNTTTFTYSGGGRFVDMAAQSAKTAGTEYINHNSYCADRYKANGASVTNAMFPKDHTHTNAAGAKLVAAAFVRALLCGKNESGLRNFILANSTSPAGKCL